jgi:hypothetical protein
VWAWLKLRSGHSHYSPTTDTQHFPFHGVGVTEASRPAVRRFAPLTGGRRTLIIGLFIFAGAACGRGSTDEQGPTTIAARCAEAFWRASVLPKLAWSRNVTDDGAVAARGPADLARGD